MKKLSLVLVIALVVVSSLCCFAFADEAQEVAQPVVETSQQAATQPAEEVNNLINNAGNTAMEFAQNIMDQLTIWSLPFCAIGVVWGAVQFFIMGIRNLYKKRQGLLLMFGSMTFYVVVLGVDLILAFLIG